MDLKVLYFFIMIFVISVTAVAFAPASTTNKSLEKFETKETPVFEFKEYTLFEITEKGVEKVIKAESGAYFESNKNISKKVLILTSSTMEDGEDIVENLLAEKMTNFEGKLELEGSVSYTKNDGTILNTRDVQYNIKDELVESESEFDIYSTNIFVQGKGFKLYKKDEKLVATDIIAKIELKNQ